MSNSEKSEIARVVYEYADGSTASVSGDDAKKWINFSNAAIGAYATRSWYTPVGELKWVRTPPTK